MTITDDDLTRALAAAADAIEVPEWEGLDVPEPTPVWRRRSTHWLVGVAAAAGLIVAVAQAGGTHADKNVPSAGRASADQPAGDSSSNLSGVQHQNAPGLSAGQPASSYGIPAAASAVTPLGSVRAPAGGSVGAGTTGGSVQAPAAPAVSVDTSRVVKTGSISLVVDDGKVPATMIKLRQVAASVRGFLAEEKTQGVGSDPSGVATMRVPVASFDAVVTQISGKGFGAKVTGVESSGKDITAEYADTEAQIKSLKAAHDRYLTILNGADTIGEILSVQQRVDDVQKQIDRLEGSRRLLANQSDLATLTVSVNQKASQVLVRSEQSGWSKAWHDSTHGFTSGIQSIVAHSGRALLVLLVGIACVVLARGGWRVARRRLI